MNFSDTYDATGAVIQTYTYEPFGTTRIKTGTSSNPWTFTGRFLDAESSLHFLRNRYYDSRTGTFLSQDPIGVQGGINLYGYVGNNPVNLTDPFGWEPGNRAPVGRFGDYLVVQGSLGPRFIDQRGQLVAQPGYQDSLSVFVNPWAQVVVELTFGNPARTLRWMSRTLSETGHRSGGRLLGTSGLVLEPGGPGKITGLAVGGSIGAAAGGYFGGPWGGIVGGIVVGGVFGTIGSWFDSDVGDLE